MIYAGLQYTNLQHTELNLVTMAICWDVKQSLIRDAHANLLASSAYCITV